MSWLSVFLGAMNHAASGRGRLGITDNSTAMGESAETRRRVTQQGQKAADLQGRIDRLQLACMAMWELVKEKTGLTDDDLAEKIRLIDLADGQEDGKVTKTLRQCPKCGRAMSPRHRKCLYCGKANSGSGPFDAAS